MQIITEGIQTEHFISTNRCHFILLPLQIWEITVEIGWNPPPEPTRTSPRDCEDWPHSTCKLTDNGEMRCLCNETFRWDGNALKCTQRKNGNYSLKGYDICATGKNVPVEKGRIGFPSNGWPGMIIVISAYGF